MFTQPQGWFGLRKPSRAFSAIVCKDGSTVWAEDASGKTIASGESGVDDAGVIQSAINHINEGGKLYISEGEYIIGSKLRSKNINLEGGGMGTILRAADGLNDDIIEIYSGGTLDWRYYYQHGRIAHLKIKGNRSKQTSGNGIVLAWTQHFIIEDVRIEGVYEYGIKLLRSYWSAIRDVWVHSCGYGIKIGEYDAEGKYNAGSSADLYSNSNILQNVHVSMCNYGIHIESGDLNELIKCDTSACDIGVLLQPVSGVDKVWRTILFGHGFENCEIGIKSVDAGSEGCRYTLIVNPVFTSVSTGYDMGDNHYLIINTAISSQITLQRYHYISVGDMYIQEYLNLTRGTNYIRSYWGDTYIQGSTGGGESFTNVAKISSTTFDLLRCTIDKLISAKGIFPITLGTQSIAAGATALAAKFTVPTGKTLKIHAIAELYDPDGYISAEVYNVTDAETVASVDGFDDTGWSVAEGKDVEFRVINSDGAAAHDGNYGFLVSFV